MAKQNRHFAHFSVGEYSAAGLARVDIDSTLLAAETQENVFSHAVGKGQVRPGTTYLGTTPDNERVRLIPFVRDIDDVALIEMSAGTLRVWVDDVPITRAAVTSTVTNGDFSSATGWTLSASSGAHATISGGKLTLDADARGSLSYCEQSVSTSSAGTEHALRIVVTRGPVLFRCGSTSGGQEYISESSLDTGVHSLAFTPTASPYYVRFVTRNQRDCIVDSITVEAAGIMELSAPWTAAQLREIAFDQSADVIFLAHNGWQQRKIERRSTTSWSLSVYQSDDGPFTYPPGNITVTPSATFGNITLTANKPVFDPNMVGSLVRLYHPNLKGTWRLGSDGEFTDVFQVIGIKGERFNDRTFYYQVSGTWSGTMRVQRSLTGANGDFVDYNIDDGVTATTFTSNRSVTHVGQEEDNNVISYFRIGFIDGAYNSGNAVVSVQYTGFGGYGIGRITSYQSETKVSVEVLDDFNATDATDSWEIGEWSNYYGWPSAVALFDGRLWWGGQDKFWGSESDAYYTYDDLESGDSATIKRQVATGGQINQINWFLPLQRLLIGTTGSIASARASSFDEPLTPNGVTVKDAATFGGSTVSPIKLDSRGIFVHRSRESVHALLYTVDANDYAPRDLTGNSDGICGDGIVEIAASREPETYVWCVREDGQIAILIYEYAEGLNVQGWSRFVTNGVIESVCVLPGANEDDVYLAVDRTNEDEIVTTGAEVLARGESAAWDFTDQSVYVLDNTTPANNENSYGAQTDGYGTPIGADANILSYTASNECDPKMLLLPTGFLGYQPHNFVTASEDLSDASWLKENVWISSETYEAPDGTMTARKVAMQNTGGSVAHSLRTIISRDAWSYNSGSSANRTRLELSFWAKPQVQSSAWSRWVNASFTDQIVVGGTQTASSNESFNVATGSTDNLGLVERTNSGSGFGTGTWRNHDGLIEEYDNGWYRFNLYISTYLDEIALEFNFYTGSDDGSVGSSSFLGDDYSGPLIWGVQVNMTPTVDFHNDQISTYVKTGGNPRILLPYLYDNAGALRGIRIEPQTKNILSHDRTFTTAPYALSNATLTSGEFSPNMMFDGTILTESGSTSPHYLEYPFVGPNDLYALSLYVKTAELSNIALQLISATDDRYLATFNAFTHEMTLEAISGATNTRYGIEDLPYGWSRVWISSDVIVNEAATFSIGGTSTATFARGGSAMSSPSTGAVTFRPTGWSALTAGGTTGGSWYGEAPVAAAEPTNYMLNGSFETGDKTNWTNTVGTWSVTAFAPWIPVPDGSFMATTFTSSAGFLFQDNDIIANGMYTSGEIATGTATINVSYWYGSGTSNNSAVVTIRALNSGGGVISTLSSVSNLPAATNTWYFNETGSLTLPTNTAKVRITLTVSHTSGFFYDAKFDDIRLTKPVDPGLTTMTGAGAASTSLVALPEPAFSISGTSATSFAAQSTALADLSLSGTATTDLIPSVGTMSATGSSAASFDVSNIIMGSAIVSTNAATGIFYDADIVATTLTDAGTSTASWVGKEKIRSALFRVFLVDTDEPTLNSEDSPVHESTGSSLVIWGAQLEYGRNSASTFATIAGETVRKGDVYNTPLTDVPWDQTMATLYVEAEQIDATASGALGSENTGPAFGVDSGGDDVHFLRSDTARDMRYEILNNGAVEASIDGGTWTVDTTFELASSATTNDARLVVDHGTATQDTSVTMPTIPQAGSLVVFGHSDDGLYSFDGILKRAALIMDVSTDTELQDLGNPEELPTMRFVEKLNLRSEAIGDTVTKMADAGIYAAGPVSSVTAAWLAERTNLVGWGTLVSDGLTYPLTGLSADTSGVIALGDTYTGVFVGLGYDARYKTGKLAYAATGGTALLQRKRVGEMSLLLANTHRDAVRFGADFTTMRKMDLIKGGLLQSATTVNAVYDEIGFSFPGEWATDARLCLKVSAPYPCTFLGLVIAVETNERGLG